MPPSAEFDETATIRPKPRSSIPGATRWAQLKVPRRLTPRMRFQSSGVTRSSSCVRHVRGGAGVRDQDVDRPEALLDLGHHGVDIGRLGYIPLDSQRSPPAPAISAATASASSRERE